MGLFVQEIVLRLSDNKNVIEKVELPKLTKEKIDLIVTPGTIAYVGGVKYKGQERPHQILRSMIGVKNVVTEAFLFPDKNFDSLMVSFFGGQHVVSVSSLPSAKAKFSIVGTASVEIADYQELANHYNRTMTRESLVDDINKTVRAHLSDEVSVAASKYITAETTEITLRSALNDIAKEVISSRKTASALMNLGLILSARGISMHINPIEDTENILNSINSALADKAISSLDNDKLEREDRERSAERQHEIDLIRANRTDITENTNNINNNGNGGNVTINNNGSGEGVATGKKFCPNCGAKLTGSGKFCPECGEKL